MVYAIRPFNEIYTNYNAPNNHILFNMLLNIWLVTAGSLFQVSELPFRLFTAMTSLTAVFLMFTFWHKRMGLFPAFLTILCFTVSMPFMIYGTAVRGYMLSFVFILCGLESGLKFIEKGKGKYAFLYFLSALGAIAVIPSNLIAIAIIAILPPKKSEMTVECIKVLIKKRWLMVILSITAFLIFYSPIFPKLYRALKINNGWLSLYAATVHLYSAFLLSLLPAILLAVIGNIIIFKRVKNNPIGKICLLVIFLAPVIVSLPRKPVPFPRVFFQMWPIWLFLIGIGIKRLLSFLRLKGNSRKIIWSSCLISTLLIISWGIINYKLSPVFSKLFTKRFSQDDYFLPSFMTSKFKPLETVETIMKLSGKKPKTVFLSQNSDFISIIFYGELKGIDRNFWISDYPGKKELEGATDADKYFIVARNENDLNLIKKRFNLKKVKPIITEMLDNIYEVEK